MAAPLLTTYTSYAEVRSALGVEIKELPDATLALEMHVEGLLSELRDISADLPADFAVVVAVVVDSRSAVQAAFYGAVKQFAPYAVAASLTPSLAQFAPKSITDGKAGLGRFAEIKESIKLIKERYALNLVRLKTAYAALSADTDEIPVRVFLTAVSPDTDEVTDEAPA